jgi:hypothetical protein
MELDHLNKLCEQCGEKYHHCSSCGYDFVYDEDSFCSEKCSRMHEQGKQIEKDIDDILAVLDEDLKTKFANIICPRKEVPRDPTFDIYPPSFEGDSPFDEDLVREILDDRYGGCLGISSWGLW